MPYIRYQKKNFSAASGAIIQRANVIIDEYAAQGFDLTLRQLYYQFVARGFIPNRDSEYKRLGSIINDARLAGHIDWDSIIDRTRNLRRLSTWESPAGVIKSASELYREDCWRSQPLRIEVWIEKDALVGVIQGICQEWGVPYFSCRGYTSQSEMWAAAQRIGQHIAKGKRVLLLHLGDHDPSGIDMSRDIHDRLEDFIVKDWHRQHVEELGERSTYAAIKNAMDASLGVDVSPRPLAEAREWQAFQMQRIALNWNQIEEYEPPPNPAKVTDSRSGRYIAEHGNESWELDALDPATLAGLINDEFVAEIDMEAWEAAKNEEKRGRNLLEMAVSRWSEMEEILQNGTA